jgi:hypothetical protein
MGGGAAMLFDISKHVLLVWLEISSTCNFGH